MRIFLPGKENTPTKDGDTISIVPSIAAFLSRVSLLSPPARLNLFRSYQSARRFVTRTCLPQADEVRSLFRSRAQLDDASLIVLFI